MAPALCLVALIWGGSYPAVKVAQATIPPIPLAALRCAVAALVLLGITRVAGGDRARLGRRDLGLIALVGLTGNTVFQLCLVGGLRYTSPAHSALIVSLSPIFSALLARVGLGEPLGGRRAAGILVSFAGVALLVTRDESGPAAGALVGDFLSLGAAFAWAVSSVAGKPALAAHSALRVTTLAMVAGAAPLVLLGGPGLLAVPWSRLPGGLWVLLAYISIIALTVSYLLFYWALARAAIARVAVFQYLTPVFAVLLAVALGQQALSGTLVLSALAVIGGVALAQRA